MKKKELSKKIKAFFCFDQIGHQLVGNSHGYLGTYCLTDVMGLPLAVVTLITSAGSIISSIFSFFIGIIMEKGKPGRFGKIRKWLLILPPIWMVINTLMFVYIPNDTLRLPFLMLVWIVGNCVMIFMVAVPVNMVGVLASTSSERSLLSGRRTMYMGIGRLLYSVITMPLLAFLTTLLGKERLSYPVLLGFYSLIAASMYLISFKMTAGYEPTDMDYIQTEQESDKKEAKTPSISDMLKNICTNLPLGIHSFSYLASVLTMVLTNTMLIYYYTYVAENTALYSVNIACNSIAAVLSGILLPALSKKMSNKSIALLAYGMMFAGLLTAWQFGIHSVIAFLAGASIMSFGCNLGQATGIAMFGDCATYAEWKTGVDSRATIMGLNSICISVSGVLTRVISMACLSASGYVVGQAATVSVKSGLLNAYAVCPMLFSGAAFLLTLFFYRLTNEKLVSYQNEISSRQDH